MNYSRLRKKITNMTPQPACLCAGKIGKDEMLCDKCKKTMKLPKHKKGNVTAKTLEKHVRKFKPSELFEGKHSALYRTFAEIEQKAKMDEAIASAELSQKEQGSIRRKFYQMGYDDAMRTVHDDLLAVADAGEYEVLRVEVERYFNQKIK